MPEGYNPAAEAAAREFNQKMEKSRPRHNVVMIEGAAAEKLQRELEIGVKIRRAETFDALADAGAELLLEAETGEDIEKIQKSVDTIRALPEQLKTQAGREVARWIGLRMITKRAGLRERAGALIDEELVAQKTAVRKNPLFDSEAKDSSVGVTQVVKPLDWNGPKDKKRAEGLI